VLLFPFFEPSIVNAVASRNGVNMVVTQTATRAPASVPMAAVGLTLGLALLLGLVGTLVGYWLSTGAVQFVQGEQTERVPANLTTMAGGQAHA
jgi:hypothetical protein